MGMSESFEIIDLKSPKMNMLELKNEFFVLSISLS